MIFAQILIGLLLLTGGIWLLDKFVLRARRTEEAVAPWWVEYSRSFFPVILAVFALRSFLFEPFKIPSGSMIPTLQVGDYILVNKYTYGIRLPLINKKIVSINEPQRGDVMVFHYPEDPSTDFIKRVIGLPGDVIEYRSDKQLLVNGVAQERQPTGQYDYEEGLNLVHTSRYQENLGGHAHSVIINPDASGFNLGGVANFPLREACSYTLQAIRCTVPDGHYFMLGDNRDNSRDSRYWGFVPDNLIVGKAILVWWNLGDLHRIGTSID
ncbi:MAG: signal peptidase I [Gallionellaceae bacterium]|jgi:signal peptidase I|nr:signal peptidase I [Gallionellaceae bacterium]